MMRQARSLLVMTLAAFALVLGTLAVGAQTPAPTTGGSNPATAVATRSTGGSSGAATTVATAATNTSSTSSTSTTTTTSDTINWTPIIVILLVLLVVLLAAGLAVRRPWVSDLP